MATNKNNGPQSAPADEPAPVKEGYVRIRINPDAGDGGKDDVFASDGQGGQVLIQRGKVVDVPMGVYHGLTLAVIEHYETDSNGGIVGQRSVPRFNVTVLG